MADIKFKHRKSEYERLDTFHSARYAMWNGAKPETHIFLFPHGHNRYFALHETIFGFEWQERSIDDTSQTVAMMQKQAAQDAESEEA